ncbi:MAG: hypothetical protein ACRCV6_00405 [Formosimonas sp.]
MFDLNSVGEIVGWTSVALASGALNAAGEQTFNNFKNKLKTWFGSDHPVHANLTALAHAPTDKATLEEFHTHLSTLPAEQIHELTELIRQLQPQQHNQQQVSGNNGVVNGINQGDTKVVHVAGNVGTINLS